MPFFTLCIAVYSSAVAVEPRSNVCVKVDQETVWMADATCLSQNLDPLTTCEFRRAGALKYFMTVRQIGGQ